jgi:hypothetical protein
MTLETERTLFIGIPDAGIPGVKRRDFFDTFNIDEYKFIVWNIASLVHQAKRFGIDFNGINASRQYKNFLSKYLEKGQELLSWVSKGHVLVIIPSELPPLRHQQGQETPVKEDISTHLPLGFVGFSYLPGELVEADQFEHSKNSRHSSHKYTLSGKEIIPLFKSSTAHQGQSRLWVLRSLFKKVRSSFLLCLRTGGTQR